LEARRKEIVNMLSLEQLWVFGIGNRSEEYVQSNVNSSVVRAICNIQIRAIVDNRKLLNVKSHHLVGPYPPQSPIL